MLNEQNGRNAGRDHEVASILELVNIVLRYRLLVLVLVLGGAALAVAVIALQRKTYESTALIQPETAENRSSNLALLATRFGIQGVSNTGGWSAALYEELLRTRAMLEPIARGSMTLTRVGGGSIPVMAALHKLELTATDTSVVDAVDAIRAMSEIRLMEEIGAVRIVVSSPSAMLSWWLARSLVERVDDFAVERRMSQAAEERVFVEEQAIEAEAALTAAEERLLDFLRKNRDFQASPELRFQHDRLQRVVELRQQVYTSLVENLAEARVREVRDTPVVTVLETPRLPESPRPRRFALNAILGAILGGLLGALASLARWRWLSATEHGTASTREFTQLMRETLTPWRSRR